MSLAEYRKKVDAVDDQILRLLQQRIELSKKIGQVKRQSSLPIHDQRRESRILNRVRGVGRRIGFDPHELEAVYRRILTVSRQVQGEDLKIAYLGPRGTFCEQAARTHFRDQPATYTEKSSIADVFRSVDAKEEDFGVVPVENSIEGSVNITLDLLFEFDLKVYGEIEGRIRHNLLSRPETSIRDVGVILSHPQALAQCRRFIESNLPNAELREESSTARAAQKARRMKGSAAIGTELAADIYGMTILARGIENTRDNYTRFFVLSHRSAEPTGRDKTSIIYSIPHAPGSLQRSLEIFARRGINLTKIESRPMQKAPWEYFFYCDFEGHLKDRKYAEALKEFEKKCALLKVLGSYPRAR